MPDLNAARNTDSHTCPSFTGNTPHVGGPINTSSKDVLVEDLGAVRAGLDTAICAAGGPDKIAQGSAEVFVNDKNMARHTEQTSHAGTIVGHAGTVIVGGATVTVVPIRLMTGEATPARRLGPPSANPGASDAPKSDDKSPTDGKAEGDKAKETAKDGEKAPDNPPADPINRFDIFHQESGRQVNLMRDVDDLIEGETYEARSTSYDPDDTTTGEPLKGITAHVWSADFPIDNAANSSLLVFKAPPARMDYVLQLTVTDNDNAQADRAVWFNTRRLVDCESARRVRAAALGNITTAEYLMGRPQTARTWRHWLGGSGVDLPYEVAWYRGHFSVTDAENEFALRVLARAEKDVMDTRGPVEFGSAGYVPVTLIAESVYRDLATTMGNHSLGYKFSASATQDRDGTIIVSGAVDFNAADRFNWQKGKSFPSLIAVPIPLTGGHVLLPAAVNDTYWQVLEDCHHAAPFNMIVRYSLKFRFARTAFGPVFRWE